MSDYKMTFTYLNVRQSIAILLAKLIVIDVVLAAIVVGFYWVLVLSNFFLNVEHAQTYIFLGVFGLCGLIKIAFSVYIVLQWLNEYYEITPEYIYHKKGIVFRKTEQYRIDHVRRIDVQDSFLGEIFNYATIVLYDIRLNRYLDLYLIHNARRYAHILKQLKPSLEMAQDRVRLPFLPKDIEEDKNILESENY